MKFKEVITRDAAEVEINDWLDWKKITPAQRETHKDHIDALIEGLQYGFLTLKDNAFKQTLLFPTEGEAPVTEFNYKARINAVMLAPYLSGVKSGDGDARVIANLACLTAQPKQILKQLDPQDKRICDSIVVFFLS